MTKKEKLKKAKALHKELMSLKLTDEEMKTLVGGSEISIHLVNDSGNADNSQVDTFQKNPDSPVQAIVVAW